MMTTTATRATRLLETLDARVRPHRRGVAALLALASVLAMVVALSRIPEDVLRQFLPF